jgi:hypothetical protein
VDSFLWKVLQKATDCQEIDMFKAGAGVDWERVEEVPPSIGLQLSELIH